MPVDAKAKAVLDAAASAHLPVPATQAALWMKLGGVNSRQVSDRFTVSAADLSKANKLIAELAPSGAIVPVQPLPPAGESLTRPVSRERPSERVSPAPEVNAQAVIWRTPDPPANPQPGDVWVNPQDGAQMVYVPQGEFILGSSDAQLDVWREEVAADQRDSFGESEQPQCRVNLPGYWIGRTEVTNAQYLRFVQVTGHRAPKHWKGAKIPSGLESFPVV